ncbi:MAG: L-dopachrome tautomerase-related protein [Acidobacteriaceae bacterium]|nr:L-dopachrome tautomerase-related protein [Acidobacteriaceae bacterium]
MFRQMVSALVALYCCVVSAAQTSVSVETVVASPYPSNGAAVSGEGRIFLSLPHILSSQSFSLGEYKAGEVRPYPGGRWNASTGTTKNRFSQVNAVRIEPDHPSTLWVVDCGTGMPGETKLVAFDLKADRMSRVYRLNPNQAPLHSCLNDVRVLGRHAFLTESGTGALIVIDLDTGSVRRLLSASSKTKAPHHPALVIDGAEVLDPSGVPPVTHADDIEITPDHQWLYFSVPFGGTLWKVRIADLLNTALSEEELDQRVFSDGPIIPIGGFLMLSDGSLLLGDLEHHALVRRFAGGKMETVFTSPLLQWPDAMAAGPDGKLYEAQPQAGSAPGNHHGVNATKPPYRVLRFTLPPDLASLMYRFQ